MCFHSVHANPELGDRHGADPQKHENWGLPQAAHCLVEETGLVNIKAFIHPTEAWGGSMRDLRREPWGSQSWALSGGSQKGGARGGP